MEHLSPRQHKSRLTYTVGNKVSTDLPGPATGTSGDSSIDEVLEVRSVPLDDAVVYEPRSNGYKWQSLCSKGDATTIMHARKDEIVKDVPALFEATGVYADHFIWNNIDYHTSVTEDFRFWRVPAFWSNPLALPGSSIDVDIATEFNLSNVLSFRRSCLEDFNAQLQDASNVNGSLIIAELHKTIHLLRNPASALFTSASKLGRDYNRYAKTAKNLTKLASDLYLEYRFGWKPLLYDIDDTLTAVKQELSKSYEDRASLKRLESFSCNPLSLKHSSSFDIFSSVETRRVEVLSFCKYSAAIKREPQSELENTLSNFGFMPRSLASTIYEVIPFSFVVDYFANINNLLSYDPTAKQRIRYTSRTYRDTYTIRYTSVGKMEPAYAAHFKDILMPGEFTCTRTTVHRSREPELGDFLIPKLRNPPRLQLYNLAALASSLTLR